MIHRSTQRGCALAFEASLLVCAAPSRAQQGPDHSSAGDVEARTQSPDSDENRPLGLARTTPAKGEVAAPSTVADFTRTALSLAGVVALAVLASVVVRKIARSAGGLGAAMGAGGRSPAGVMEVLGRYPIARGQSLVLLKLDRRVLLLSHAAGARAGAGGMNCLTEISDPDEVASILIKVRDADGASLATRFEASMDDAQRDAERAEFNPPTHSGQRRTTVSPAGDRVELLGGGPPKPAREPSRGYTAQPPRPAPAESRPDVDAAAEVLRRRLHLLNDPKRGDA